MQLLIYLVGKELVSQVYSKMEDATKRCHALSQLDKLVCLLCISNIQSGDLELHNRHRTIGACHS